MVCIQQCSALHFGINGDTITKYKGLRKNGGKMRLTKSYPVNLYKTLQPKRTQQDIIYTIYISFFCWDKTLLQNLFLTGERLGERVNRATGWGGGKKTQYTSYFCH
jgi:hypothetical protein